ncbi:hypothetical protein [Dyadobacter bucti]|uniref:hypothetical protein n=1 Tax=Dyadobacter bucti TaxID=2572203 RepID=UPI003F70DC30
MESNIEFISPVDGDMLHANDGIMTEEYLQVLFKIAAPEESRLTLNDTETEYQNGIFTAEIRLHDYENTIHLRDETTGEEKYITVYRLKNFANKYRLSIDDNIWFLRDIQEHADSYNSLFDNPYLAFLKEVNDRYGTKIHLNLFYQTDGIFQKDDFNLSKFTAKFKNEWRENAGWLTLSFHALGEFPDQPYINAGYDEVKKDCDLVVGEIKRFAGEEVMTSVTTIHWGEATRDASRVLRNAGYKGQLGYFNIDDDQYSASYYLSEEQRRHIKKRFVWKDHSEDIVFIKTSIVIDTKTLEEIVPHLNSYLENANRPPYLDLLVHEQYFYPFYFNYQPDYREKILAAVNWAHENGYEPALLGDVI